MREEESPLLALVEKERRPSVLSGREEERLVISKRKAKKKADKKKAETFGTPEFFKAVKKHDKKADAERRKLGLRYVKRKMKKK